MLWFLVVLLMNCMLCATPTRNKRTCTVMQVPGSAGRPDSSVHLPHGVGDWHVGALRPHGVGRYSAVVPCTITADTIGLTNVMVVRVYFCALVTPN